MVLKRFPWIHFHALKNQTQTLWLLPPFSKSSIVSGGEENLGGLHCHESPRDKGKPQRQLQKIPGVVSQMSGSLRRSLILLRNLKHTRLNSRTKNLHIQYLEWTIKVLMCLDINALLYYIVSFWFDLVKQIHRKFMDGHTGKQKEPAREPLHGAISSFHFFMDGPRQ